MTDRPAFLALLAASGITPDKPLHAVLVAVHDAATTAREAVGSARLVDQKAADELVRRLAVSADAAAKTTARAEVREGVRRQAGWLAGAGVALALLSLAAGFGWGRVSAPACPAGAVREAGGARWCLLGQSPGGREAGKSGR